MKEVKSSPAVGNPDGGEKGSFEESCLFIEALVQVSQLYGVSSHAMVTSFSRITKALGLNGEFIATPSYVQTILWGEDDHQQRVHLAVSRSGNYDLAKLARVSKLAELVETGSIRPTEGLERLQDIMLADDEYGPLENALAFMLCAAAFAVVIGGSWMDALFGAVFSLASYGVTFVAGRLAGVASLQEFLAAMIAVTLGNMAAMVFPGTNPMAVAVCACVWFLPGFGLTIAPNELVVGNTLSGIIYLTNALVTALKLVGGAVIGVALVHSAGFNAGPVSSAAHIASVWNWAAAPGLVIGLAVLFKVNWRNFGAILLGAWLTWGAMQLGNPLGYWQGTFFGATVLLIYTRWYAHWFGLPFLVILLPCVMILVPGLAALEALQKIQTEGLLPGYQAAYKVLILIMAIIGGAILGEALTLGNLAKTGKSVMSLVGWPVSYRKQKRGG